MSIQSRFSERRIASFAVATLLGGSFAAGAAIIPLGGEIALSVPDGDSESYPSFAADGSGGFLAVWRREPIDGGSVTTRSVRVDRDGATVESSRRSWDLEAADVALAGDGAGVVVGLRGGASGIELVARCFDAAGSATGESRVDTSAVGRSPFAPRSAVLTDGSIVVAWEDAAGFGISPAVLYRKLHSDCAVQGDVRAVDTTVVERRTPHVVGLPDGGFAIVWVSAADAAERRIRLRRYDLAGEPNGAAFPVDDGPAAVSEPALAADVTGAIAVSWRTAPATTAPGTALGIAARVLEPGGGTAGPQLALRPSREPNVAAGGVAAVAGAFVAVWTENGFVEQGSGVFARAFDADSTLGGEISVAETHTDPGRARVAALGGAAFAVVWDDLAETTLPPDIVARRFAFLAAPGTCVEDDATLCLLDGRLRVEVEWTNFVARAGAGHAHPLTSDSGLYWFFDADNLEFLVKGVDACAEFGKRWLFAAATTNVEYRLTVTDTMTGASRSYFNVLGRSAPAITDTDAFDCP